MMRFLVALLLVGGFAVADDGSAPGFILERTVAHSGFDGARCWVHARAGAIPPGAAGNPGDQPRVVMTMQELLLSGSDIFYELHQLESDDLGHSWSEPSSLPSFARQVVEEAGAPLPTGAAIAPDLLQPGDETTVCDFWPKWHAATGTLLGTGHTVWYRDNHVMRQRPRGTAYAVFDTETDGWSAWRTLEMPDDPKFRNAGGGCVQRVDLPGGDILLPIYFKDPTATQYSVTVCRCRFDGETLSYAGHGSELSVPIKRGLYEPSLSRFGDRFYLTMRNDDQGYISVSDDGQTFSEPQPWTFDDGSPLGNYNTQQHWVTHSGGLFLVYTRRGADNDHVFRHRAPLFIARVDPERLQVIRSSEQILVPERGARLGNFGVVDVTPEETWVTVTEWMQPAGVEERGSDNSVFVAKILWDQPNELVAASADQADAWETIAPYFTPPDEWRDDYGDYRSPLEFRDGTIAKTPEAWQRRRQEILDDWTRLLGEWPPLLTDQQLEVLSTEQRDDITQHQVRFRWTPDEETTGYLLVPPGEGPFPAVITVFYEPETAIGLGSREYRDFAIQLARRGFVALSIGTTEATEAQTYALYYPSLDDAQVQPLSMLGCAAANAWHVLANRPEVDESRIGIVGHSFGGKWAMFASCLFDKFACAAWSDPGIVFDEQRPSVNYWEPWYLGYHPKPWRKRGVITPDNPARGLYPQLVQEGYDLHELHALMAPRPFLVSGGSEDPPKRWQALNHSVAVNELLGQSDRVGMTNRPEHSPNAESNGVIYGFFEHWLRGAR